MSPSASIMTVEETILPFLSPEEKLKLLFRLHVVRVSIIAPSSYHDSRKAAIEDEVTDKTYSVCMERNGKFQATKEGKTVLPFDKVGNRSCQTFEFNETISLVR